jgi:hypothetical protein
MVSGIMYPWLLIVYTQKKMVVPAPREPDLLEEAVKWYLNPLF